MKTSKSKILMAVLSPDRAPMIKVAIVHSCGHTAVAQSYNLDTLSGFVNKQQGQKCPSCSIADMRAISYY
jgi:hypothetical protein